jgi:hypothetical protein
MKVKCINTCGYHSLTKDIIYDVVHITRFYYHIINDNKNIMPYSYFMFKSLFEIRNDKIDKLLEDEN